MRLSYVLFLLLVVTLAGTTAHAQSRLGVDGLFVFPLGDLDDVVDQGGGLGVYYKYAVNPNIELRADAAFLAFRSEIIYVDDPIDSSVETSVSVVPIRAGADYLIRAEDSRVRFYVGFLIGAYIRTFEVEADRSPGQSANKTRFGIAPELGMVIPFYRDNNKLDIGASYDVWFGDETILNTDAILSFIRIDVGISFVWGTTRD